MIIRVTPLAVALAVYVAGFCAFGGWVVFDRLEERRRIIVRPSFFEEFWPVVVWPIVVPLVFVVRRIRRWRRSRV